MCNDSLYYFNPKKSRVYPKFYVEKHCWGNHDFYDESNFTNPEYFFNCGDKFMDSFDIRNIGNAWCCTALWGFLFKIFVRNY